MFDLEDIRSIHIDYYGLDALLTHNSNNPLAESEIPPMLREAIARNIPVRAVDTALGTTYRLYVENGEFRFAPEPPAAVGAASGSK